MIGQKLEVRHPSLQPGSKFHYGRRDWNIAGVFSDNDSARESEIWTDIEDPANRRPSPQPEHELAARGVKAR